MNLNDNVYVKLTDVGRNMHREQAEDLRRMYPGISEYTPPVEDEEGWSKWQLWDLMSVFGSAMGPGFCPPMSTEIRVDL